MQLEVLELIPRVKVIQDKYMYETWRLEEGKKSALSWRLFPKSSRATRILQLVDARQEVMQEMPEIHEEVRKILERGERLVWGFGGSKWLWIRGRLRGVQMAPMQKLKAVRLR